MKKKIYCNIRVSLWCLLKSESVKQRLVSGRSCHVCFTSTPPLLDVISNQNRIQQKWFAPVPCLPNKVTKKKNKLWKCLFGAWKKKKPHWRTAHKHTRKFWLHISWHVFSFSYRLQSLLAVLLVLAVAVLIRQDEELRCGRKTRVQKHQQLLLGNPRHLRWRDDNKGVTQLRRGIESLFASLLPLDSKVSFKMK